METQIKKELIELLATLVMLITVITITYYTYQHSLATERKIQEIELIMQKMQSNNLINK